MIDLDKWEGALVIFYSDSKNMAHELTADSNPSHLLHAIKMALKYMGPIHEMEARPLQSSYPDLAAREIIED